MYRVEITIFAQQQVAHLRHQLLGAAAADKILRRQRARLVHLLLQVEQRLEFIQQRIGSVYRLWLRQPH